MEKLREKLKELGSNERHTFTGEFARTGFKTYRCKCSPTILLKNIKIDDELMTDHLWLSYGKNFLKLGKLEVGDIIKFDGRVDSYEKGYIYEQTLDYRIVRPTKVQLIKTNHNYQKVPLDNRPLIGMILTDNEEFYRNAGRSTTDNDYYLFAYHQWKQGKWKTKK